MSPPASKAVNQLAEAARLHHVRLREMAGEFAGLVRQDHALRLHRHRLAEAGENVEAVAIGEQTILAEIANHVADLSDKAEG